MNKTIFPCVVGLGYVGLPVFTRLNKFYKTVGYDINKERVNEYFNEPGPPLPNYCSMPL